MEINTNQKQNIISVNGKVGEVQLLASDIGALSKDTNHAATLHCYINTIM